MAATSSPAHEKEDGRPADRDYNMDLHVSLTDTAGGQAPVLA